MGTGLTTSDTGCRGSTREPGDHPLKVRKSGSSPGAARARGGGWTEPSLGASPAAREHRVPVLARVMPRRPARHVGDHRGLRVAHPGRHADPSFHRSAPRSTRWLSFPLVPRGWLAWAAGAQSTATEVRDSGSGWE